MSRNLKGQAKVHLKYFWAKALSSGYLVRSARVSVESQVVVSKSSGESTLSRPRRKISWTIPGIQKRVPSLRCQQALRSAMTIRSATRSAAIENLKAMYREP